MLDRTRRIEKQIKLFDKHRLSDVRLFLLRHSSHSGKFEVIQEILTGWLLLEDADFRDLAIIRITTHDESFANIWAQATHIGFGKGDELDVYAKTEKTAHQPTATSPTWKMFVERKPDLRFQIPIEEQP